MSTFAYSVAIKLSVANLASQGIRILARDLLAAHGNAVALGDKLKSLKMMAVGYGMDKAGQGMLGFVAKTMDASTEYTRQISLMNAAGMSHVEIARATASAWSTSRNVITSTAADNLKAIRELRTVFGNGRMGEAYGILPTVQRTKGILEALTGKEQEGVAFDMVKAIEMRTSGVMTAARMQQNADMMAQSLMAMGGTLNVRDYHMALKQSKTAAFGLNDDFVYRYLPTLMQEVKTGAGGGGNAGTALMSLYQAVIGGTLKKSAIPMWEAMGLIRPSDVVHNAGGQLQLKPGAVAGSQIFQANPYQWANQVLAPAIATYGASHGLNREQAIAGLFGNRNAQWLANTFIGKSQQFERDKALIQSGGNSYNTYQKLLQSNPQLAEQAMHAQWQNILAILGFRILPVMLPLMVRFANGLDRIGQFFQNHPVISTGLMVGLVGVGTALSIIGKALMTVGLIRFLGMGPALMGVATSMSGFIAVAFPWIAAIAGVGAAAYAAYQHWDQIKAGFSAAWGAIYAGAVGFINGIIALANHLPFVHINPIGGGPSGSPFVAPHHSLTSKGGDVYIDGKKAGKIMAPHLLSAAARDGAGPNRGGTGFNFAMAPARPATAR